MSVCHKKRRIGYLLFFLIFTVIEGLIALFVHDAFVRPYVGDTLVVLLICCFVRIWIPHGSQFLALYVFLFASAIEVGQYFDYASLLGLGHIRFFRVLLGSAFSAADIICYACGSSIFFVLENLILSYFPKKVRNE